MALFLMTRRSCSAAFPANLREALVSARFAPCAREDDHQERPCTGIQLHRLRTGLRPQPGGREYHFRLQRQVTRILPALMIELTEQHAGDGLAAARARICGSRTSLPQQANAHSRPARAAVSAVSRDLSSWAASTRFMGKDDRRPSRWLRLAKSRSGFVCQNRR